MGANSKIEWCDHTFNPWRGCTKVSDGCKFCYAETMSARNHETLGVWGPKGTRVIASESMWRQPLKWDREAAAEGVRRRVFCASLADVFEVPETMPKSESVKVEYARSRLLYLIENTPHLDWLLLTKRPENVMAQLESAIAMFYPACFAPEWAEYPHLAASFLREWVNGNAPSNVWIGTSIEDQATADERIPHLLSIPAKVRFLSCEPLLGPVEIHKHLWEPCSNCDGAGGWSDIDPQNDEDCRDCGGDGLSDYKTEAIHWVIVGGESGPNARPMHPDWARSLRDQCVSAGVPFFFKQWGEYHPRLKDGVWPDSRMGCCDHLPSVHIYRDGSTEPGGSSLGKGIVATNMKRVGKRRAGQLLDGRTWDEFPGGAA